jgi:hypothetical protein
MQHGIPLLGFPRLSLTALGISVTVMAITSGCTPTRSMMTGPYPYRGSCVSETQLQSIASTECSAAHPDRRLPSHPFTTDGCTLSPNGSWKECCIEHDIKYWCGGSSAERLNADRVLRSCVRKDSNSLNAALVFSGVRLGGLALSPFPWRWGYGYNWLAAPSASVNTPRIMGPSALSIRGDQRPDAASEDPCSDAKAKRPR